MLSNSHFANTVLQFVNKLKKILCNESGITTHIVYSGTIQYFFREIVETMVESYSQRIFAGQRPVFDGRKNIYSREPLPIGRDKVSSMTWYCSMAW